MVLEGATKKVEPMTLGNMTTPKDLGQTILYPTPTETKQ